MAEFTIKTKDKIIMKLLHYFITEENYSPISLQGAQDEIWLENMNQDYKIVRISTKYIRNDEQLNRDLFVANRILKVIKRKTFSFNMKILNILTDIEEDIKIPENKLMPSICIKNEKDIKKNNILKAMFPNIENKVKTSKVDAQTFAKITNEINQKNKEKFSQTTEIFKAKTPHITFVLIAINVFMYLLMSALGNGSQDIRTLIFFGANVPELVRAGEYFRLISSGFLHIGLLHLLINCYSLYIIGNQVETFFGKIKFLSIYLFSMLTGNLLSIVFTGGVSAGASGAIFGLLGAFLYFGYYYRAYIGNTVIRQIVPVILLNLLIGFSTPGIDNAAHIGGLVGGLALTYALGIKYKTTTNQRVNGIIISLIIIGFIGYLALFR